jgi:hypothetical protein
MVSGPFAARQRRRGAPAAASRVWRVWHAVVW